VRHLVQVIPRAYRAEDLDASVFAIIFPMKLKDKCEPFACPIKSINISEEVPALSPQPPKAELR
jgi:hypothetical protein